MPKLRVTIIDEVRNRRLKVDLPDGAAIEKLLPALAKKLGLSTTDLGGQPITYRLTHEATGRALGGDQTLASFGVGEGETLRLAAAREEAPVVPWLAEEEAVPVWRKVPVWGWVAIVVLLLVAVAGAFWAVQVLKPEPTPTVVAEVTTLAATEAPTATPAPPTFAPTSTPLPTATPVPPTDTPTPASTPQPTATPVSPTATSVPTPSARKFKVGMVSDVGGIDDASFNQNTWKGLQDAQEQLGVEAKFLESQAQADYENNITEFAEQGYDMIITVGFLLGDATYKMAKQYPDVKFAIVDFPSGGEETPNLQGILFNVDEASFPVGYVAAAMADQLDPDDPMVAYIGGMQIPPVEQFIVAYEAGVKYYNEKYGKGVKFTGVYVGDFEAPDQGKLQANSLIDEGADIIMGVGGKTGNGGIAAAKERGKWGVGVDVDQYYTLPNEKDILVTSTMKRFDKAMFTVIKSAVEGTFEGGTNYIATMENEGVGMAPFHDFEDKVPEDIKANLEQIRQGIINGIIDTGWD